MACRQGTTQIAIGLRLPCNIQLHYRLIQHAYILYTAMSERDLNSIKHTANVCQIKYSCPVYKPNIDDTHGSVHGQQITC